MDKQQHSAILMYVTILPKTSALCPSRLPHNIKQSFLCNTVGLLLVIHFKYSNVYILATR